MPVPHLKFAIITAAVLLGFSPLYANEDKLEDRESPAVRDTVLDTVRDEKGNGDPPAVSGDESDQPESPGDSHTEEDAGDPGRNQPAGKQKAVTQNTVTQKAVGAAAGDEDGTSPSGPKFSGTSQKNDTRAPTGENPDDDGVTAPAKPDHRGAEISRDDPMGRDEAQNPKADFSRGNKQAHTGAGGETSVGKTAAEGPKPRRRLFYGKIGSTGDKVFPSSPGIDRQKEFWILIFTRYSTQQGVIHDGRTAPPIFQDLNLMGMGPRAQNRFIENRKRQIAMELKMLAEAMRKGSPLTGKQLALKSRMPKDVTAEEVADHAKNLHFQRGLSDRFREGIKRSGALMAMMRGTMARYGLPEDLVYLPHVESSFVNNTLSRSGARGIWQFTRGTGRRYMRVGYLVDQRLDPVVATRSAARFLRRYHNQLKSWPLTLTSYNHGPKGVKRIIRKMGTRDLGIMIRDYNGPRFGFASKNFYAEFLAAREVARNYRRYFGELKMARPMRYASAKLPYYVYARDAAKALRITPGHLRWMNPALRRSIWRGGKRIPKGYVLRIPVKQDPLHFVAAIPKNARHKRQRPTRVVRVRRGDTLIGIGRRYGIPWRRIALANNLRQGRIRRGQRLLLPLEKRRPSARIATVAGLPSKERKKAGNADARKINRQISTAGKTTTRKITAGNITAGKFILPSIPPGKSNSVFSSDDAGLGVSYISATGRFTTSGTHHITPVSIGRANAGGQSDAGTHDLAMKDFDTKTNTGRIVAVFGESLGHYADWGNISVRRLRRLNGFSYRRQLRNGEYLLVYLKGVDPETFTQRRVKFHRNLETTFFAENSITQRRRVEVTRGQSAWKLARKNNVPLWLFFRENPGLLNNPMRIGMLVVVPVVEALPSR